MTELSIEDQLATALTRIKDLEDAISAFLTPPATDWPSYITWHYEREKLWAALQDSISHERRVLFWGTNR